MSDTPRTDAAAVSSEFIRREMDIYKHKFVLADHARELERENADLRRRLAEAERRAEYWKAEHLAGNRAIEQAERAGMERAAKVCEDVADKCQERDYFKCVEMKKDAESGANDCANAIRALMKEADRGGV